MAARAIIAEQGFEGLRTRDIADRVGINIATLHYHVPSKEALIQLVAQSLRDDFMTQHVSRPRDAMAPKERLRLEFDEVVEMLRDNPNLFIVYSELLARARRDTAVLEIMRPMLDHWFGQVESILKDGIADGSFRADLDPQTGAAMVIGAISLRLDRGWAPSASLDDLLAELLRSFET